MFFLKLKEKCRKFRDRNNQDKKVGKKSVLELL